MEKVRGCSSDGQTSLPACTLARREYTNQLTHQVPSEGHPPVSVCCRGGMICQVIYDERVHKTHISTSSTVLREARDVDAIIVNVFFLPSLESQRSLGTNLFIPKMSFVWHARSLQFHVIKQSHVFNMVWPLAAHR